jgi:hypothetical protein
MKECCVFAYYGSATELTHEGGLLSSGRQAIRNNLQLGHAERDQPYQAQGLPSPQKTVKANGE